MKKTACLILIFALCALFAACGGKNTAETTAAIAPETTAPAVSAETTAEPPVPAETLPPETAAETEPPAPPETAAKPPVTVKPVETAPVETAVETPPETTAAETEPQNVEPEIFDFATSDLSAYIILGKYLGMEVTLPAPEPVSDADVESAVDDVIAELPTAAMVTDRAAENGDKVNIAYIASIDGEAVSQSGTDGFTLVLGSHTTIDGFEEGVAGMQAGQTKTLPLTFPQTYYAEYAGRDAVFEITLNFIYPKLDDALCQTYLGVQSAEEFRALIKEEIESERAAGTEREKEKATWTKALANSRIVDYPESEVDAAFSAITAEYAALAERYGLTYETVFPTLYGIPLEQAESVLFDSAKNQVAQRLLLYAIARDMDIDVSDEKFESELAATAGIIGAESVDELIAQLGQSRTSLKEDKLYSEIMEIMMSKATFVTLQ